MTVSRRALVLAGVVAAALLVVLGNLHLVYVSVRSQPECVAHVKPGTVGEHRAWSAATSC